MQTIWYGWIPILSHELVAENRSAETEANYKKKTSDTDTSQEVNVSLNFADNHFLSSVQIDIPEIGTVNAKCKIRETGLINFEFSEIKFSKNEIVNNIFNNTSLPVLIFDIIRDVYHDHVHHEHHDDCKLKPVSSSSDNDAVTKILSQYQNKIFYYHKDSHSIKNYYYIPCSRYFKMKRRVYFLETARGEFTYAKAFIELHKSHLKSEKKYESETLKYFFDQAYNSVSILKEKLTWQIMYFISILAIIITALSLISSIEPGYNLCAKIKAVLTTSKAEQATNKDVNIKLKATDLNESGQKPATEKEQGG